MGSPCGLRREAGGSKRNRKQVWLVAGGMLWLWVGALALMSAGSSLSAPPEVADGAVDAGGTRADSAHLRSAEQEQLDDGRRTMGRLTSNLGRAGLGVLSRDNLKAFALLAGAAAGSTLLDDTIHDSVDASQSGWGSLLETGGGPVYGTVFVVGMFTAGRLSRDRAFRATTYDMLDAAVVALGYTTAVKLAVGRERPNHQDNASFPSGHTSNAFALASVVQARHGWKLGGPSYLLAGVVGASRINQEKHWLSDVVAGAALGCIVGHTVVRVNDCSPTEEASRASVSVRPMLAHRGYALQVTVKF